MAKVAIALRLTPETLEWLDGYARARKSSRQIVLEAAVESFRAECEGGVPDLSAADLPVAKQRPPQARSKPAAAPRASVAGDARLEYARNIAARQRKLNAAKDRS